VELPGWGEHPLCNSEPACKLAPVQTPLPTGQRPPTP
jgi:hypothetical protein